MPVPLLTLFYDSQCPLCAREIAMLRRKDARKGRLSFIDIAASDFDPTPYNRSLDDMMRQMHAITNEGVMLTGVEVFRQAYAQIGLGWLLAPTRWPIVRPLTDAAYRLFAWYRLRALRASDCGDGCYTNHPDNHG
ncbi:MAG: thiol-disulfide oxidoreductase DCC family protein [Planctomycetota bacterium]|jgi:predicted DCC family thiol-disulfide oxidoreductase YuxK